MAEKFGPEQIITFFADSNEAWFYEEYRGHYWVAARVPDDRFVVQANACRIGEVDLTDEKNFLGS